MATTALRPETPEERIIYNTIVWTWGFLAVRRALHRRAGCWLVSRVSRAAPLCRPWRGRFDAADRRAHRRSCLDHFDGGHAGGSDRRPFQLPSRIWLDAQILHWMGEGMGANGALSLDRGHAAHSRFAHLSSHQCFGSPDAFARADICRRGLVASASPALHLAVTNRWRTWPRVFSRRTLFHRRNKWKFAVEFFRALGEPPRSLPIFHWYSRCSNGIDFGNGLASRLASLSAS